MNIFFKSLYCILSPILLVFIFFVPNAMAEREIIKSASEYSYPPFAIVTSEEKASGFSVELLEATLNAVDLDVDFYIDAWLNIKNDLSEGKIQVLPLVARTPEREAVFDFSVPYITIHGNIFVRKDNADIYSIDDLLNKEVIVMKGDNTEDYAVREKISNFIINTDTCEDAFRLL